MSIPDIINGAFEAGAGVAVLAHIRAIWKDKEVKGFKIITLYKNHRHSIVPLVLDVYKRYQE